MSNQKIGILASGRGSNLQSIMDKIAEGLLPLEIAVVISDKADAFALERAEKAGIPNFAVIRKECADKKEFEEKIFGEYRCFNLTNGNAGHTNTFEIVQNGIYFELTKDEKRFFISNIHNIILPNKFKDKVVNAPDWIIDNKKMNLLVKDFLEKNSRR